MQEVGKQQLLGNLKTDQIFRRNINGVILRLRGITWRAQSRVKAVSRNTGA